MTAKELGVIYGGQHIGKGVTRALFELDRYLLKEGASVVERPSFWINLGLAIGLPLAAHYGKVKTPWRELMMLIGGFSSTEMWNYVEIGLVEAQTRGLVEAQTRGLVEAQTRRVISPAITNMRNANMPRGTYR